MKITINKLINGGFIAEERIGFDQTIKHINRAQKDIFVAKANLEIDSEAAYNYSYLAMLRTGRALMLSCGYRPIGGRQHKTVVEFSSAILGSEYRILTSHFDKMRKFRNRFTYDEPGILVSCEEAKRSLLKAEVFVKKTADYIQKKNPQMKLL
jgi:uncharacterized protein (UPF0332 family)